MYGINKTAFYCHEVMIERYAISCQWQKVSHETRVMTDFLIKDMSSVELKQFRRYLLKQLNTAFKNGKVHLSEEKRFLKIGFSEGDF